MVVENNHFIALLLQHVTINKLILRLITGPVEATVENRQPKVRTIPIQIEGMYCTVVFIYSLSNIIEMFSIRPEGQRRGAA